MAPAALAKEAGELSPVADAPKPAPAALPEPPPELPVEAPEAVEPPEPPKKPGAVKLPDAYAEPISPSTAQRFPHLKPYQGQLVIGGASVQVVLAGVPASEPDPGWQPAVLAVFEKRDGAFRRSRAVETLDLRAPAGETAPYAIGVDLGMEKEQKLAFVTLVYASGDLKLGKQTMTWRYDANTDTLALSIDEFAQAPVKGRGGRWQFRVTGPLAETFEGDAYFVRAADADVATLLPYRKQTMRLAGGMLELDPTTGEAPPVEGFELLLGRDSALRTLTRAASLEDCLRGTSRPRKPLKEEAKLPWILACQAATLKATVRLTPAANGKGGVSPVYVFDSQGRPVLYTALEGAKDSLDLVLPISQQVTYQLADTRYGRIIPGVGVLALAEGQQKNVELPPPPFGFLRLLPGGSKEAAFLAVKRLDRSGGDDAAIVAAGDGDSHVALASDRFLVRTWPVDLELATGGYELVMDRGGSAGFCKTRTRVEARKRVVFECPKNQAGAGDPETTYVDLAAADGRDLPLTSLRQALGVDLLAEPVDPASVKPSPLKVLRIEDEATGISIAFLPATTALSTRWDKQRHASAREDQASRFVRVMRGEGGQGLIELGCPAPGMSTFEYRLLVQKVRPDAVRLFGCHGGARQEDWLALYDKLGGVRRLLLTSETNLASGKTRPARLGVRVPAKTAKQRPDSVVKALLEGNYRVDAGGDVVVTSVTRSAKTGFAAEVSYRALTAEIPRVLALYGDKGLIRQERLAEGATAGKVVLPLGAVADSTVVRAELRGDRGVLATTPSVPLAQLLPKEGESH